LTGGIGTVGVVAVIGTIGGVTSILSVSGGVAAGGGMATVVAAGDWGVLSHPDTNQPPSTIMADAIQARFPADFFMTGTPSRRRSGHTAIDDDGRNPAGLGNPCCYRTFPRP